MKIFSVIMILGTAICSGCAVFEPFSYQNVFINGSYKFVAMDVVNYNDICLFNGVSNFSHIDTKREKLLVIGKHCESLSESISPIHVDVDVDVDLSVRDYHSILSMVRAAAASSCKQGKDISSSFCLKDEMPRSVSKKNGKYFFWYGRAANPGEVGISMSFVRRNGKFEFSE